MASGLLALMDDVAALAKLSAASIDDVATYATKTTGKTLGLVIDDAAVTPKYVIGIKPERELLIIWRITRGSLRNKLLILIPLALLLGYFAPFVITPLLMIGGSYLAFEGAEKVLEWFGVIQHHDSAQSRKYSPEELEKRTVSGAIRTDFILSAEIVAMSLAQVTTLNISMQAVVISIVGIFLTFLVYGVVAIIVKLDDIGALLIRESKHGFGRQLGRIMVSSMPKLLSIIGIIGTIAMLYVSSGILEHGFKELGWDIFQQIYRVAGSALEDAIYPTSQQTKTNLLNPLLNLIIAFLLGTVIVFITKLINWCLEKFKAKRLAS